MQYLAKFFTYTFHPLFTTFYVSVMLLHVHPSIRGRISEEFIWQMYMLLFISIVLIPVLSIFIVKKSGFIRSFEMRDRKERIIPFAIIGLMMLISSFKLIDNSGLAICGWWILSAGVALWLSIPLLIFWGKPSAHMLPMGAAVALFVYEGFTWASNDMLFIGGLFILCAGFVASSRLFLKAHTNKELIVGTILGILVILPLL